MAILRALPALILSTWIIVFQHSIIISTLELPTVRFLFGKLPRRDDLLVD